MQFEAIRSPVKLPKRRYCRDVDPRSAILSIRGFLDQLAEQLADEAHDTSVPVSEEVMSRLVQITKPGSGVTVRGIVERALQAYLRNPTKFKTEQRRAKRLVQ